MANKKIIDLTTRVPSVSDWAIFYNEATNKTYKALVSAFSSSGTGIVQTIVGGTGISVDSTDTANPIITNTAPDQTVSITAGTNITSVTGTYPNFTINAATQAGGTGDVVGPVSSTNNNIATFNGTTGKIIKDSGLSLSGSNTGDETTSRINTLYGTTNAITVGSIEIGNATDTTISRISAGKIAVEGVNVLTTNSTETVTNKRNQSRTASSTTSSNLSPDLSTANIYFRTTQTATLTIDAPTGTPVIGEVITLYVDSASAQTLTINATYKAFGTAFPATTTAGKTFMMTAMYNGTDWKTTWANAV